MNMNLAYGKIRVHHVHTHLLLPHMEGLLLYNFKFFSLLKNNPIFVDRRLFQPN
jgi:hypothetical protein